MKFQLILRNLAVLIASLVFSSAIIQAQQSVWFTSPPNGTIYNLSQGQTTYSYSFHFDFTVGSAPDWGPYHLYYSVGAGAQTEVDAGGMLFKSVSGILLAPGTYTISLLLTQVDQHTGNTIPFGASQSVTVTPPPPPPPAAPILISPTNGQTDVAMGPILHFQAVSGADNYQIYVAPADDPNFTSQEVCWFFSENTTAYACEDAYSSLYYWKVYAHSPVGGWSPSSTVWHYSTQADPGGSHAGCPYVSTWNGDVFHGENNIIPQSEYQGNGGKTVTDFYKLMSPPKTEGSQYVIKIDEFEHERSDFDQFKLLAIDHSPSTQVAVLEDGSIIQYTSPYKLANTMTPDGLDLSALDSFDKNAFAMKAGQSISLSFKNIINEFAQIGGYPQGGIILGGWMVRSGEGTDQCSSCNQKKASVGSAGSGQVILSKPASFTFRERPSLVYIPIEKLDDNMNIHFIENVFLDYANFAVLMPDNMTKNELNLISATHSVEGASTMQLSKTDGETASLKPGESIELRFQSVPLGQDLTRDFVLITQGKYEKIGTESTNDIPHQYKLMQNYPNPFNPTTTISYWLPENSQVSLKIYDILGQEVLKLVDGYQSAGIKTLNLDGSKLSSGIYFYKLHAGTYMETKKMIISK